MPRTTSEEAGSSTASEPFALHDLYPNPVRDVVTVTFTLDRLQTVSLDIADVLGRIVRVTEERARPAGPHELRVETDDLAAGVYVLRLRGDETEAAQRFVVVR